LTQSGGTNHFLFRLISEFSDSFLDFPTHFYLK
jgi:hypothetical protein